MGRVLGGWGGGGVSAIRWGGGGQKPDFNVRTTKNKKMLASASPSLPLPQHCALPLPHDGPVAREHGHAAAGQEVPLQVLQPHLPQLGPRRLPVQGRRKKRGEFPVV